jgi:hypothetical protein
MAGSASSGLEPVWRLYRNGDFVWATDGADAKSFTEQGYAAHFVDFYASPTSTGCLDPVYRLRKGTMHRMASESKAAALVQAGWVKEKVAFYGEVG